MGLKAWGLRIGNLVTSKQWKGSHAIDGVESIEECFKVLVKGYYHECIAGKYFDLDTIPLTPEWLIKFGFIRSSSTSELWSYGNTMLIWKTEYESDMLDNYYEFRFGITSSYGAHRQVRLDYVHQLQNLTFILTGEELTIKENI
ncbi:MAG: hypothetical protein ABIN91_11055 [Mucilaginibacter sp.]|uniref:hypothetical protein n=1 Tax=Mucilaginibacter sp. TaxID=1882438 RepID=UPI003263D175